MLTYIHLTVNAKTASRSVYSKRTKTVESNTQLSKIDLVSARDVLPCRGRGQSDFVVEFWFGCRFAGPPTYVTRKPFGKLMFSNRQSEFPLKPLRALFLFLTLAPAFAHQVPAVSQT